MPGDIRADSGRRRCQKLPGKATLSQKSAALGYSDPSICAMIVAVTMIVLLLKRACEMLARFSWARFTTLQIVPATITIPLQPAFAQLAYTFPGGMPSPAYSYDPYHAPRVTDTTNQTCS